MQASRRERLRERGPIGMRPLSTSTNSAMYVPIPTVQIRVDGLALRLKAQAGNALACRRDPQIADEIAVRHSHYRFISANAQVDTNGMTGSNANVNTEAARYQCFWTSAQNRPILA